MAIVSGGFSKELWPGVEELWNSVYSDDELRKLIALYKGEQNEQEPDFLGTREGERIEF